MWRQRNALLCHATRDMQSKRMSALRPAWPCRDQCNVSAEVAQPQVAQSRSPVLQEGDRVEVAQAGVELFRGRGHHARAVGAPAALLGVGGRGGVDVERVRQQALEDGPRLTGLHVDHLCTSMLCLSACQSDSAALGRDWP